MKPKPSDQPPSSVERLLILSDGKPGHVNQSIAFARHIGYEYDLVEARFKSRWFKGLSYLADRLGVRTSSFFEVQLPAIDYEAVVSAGSGTYYANRVLSAQLQCNNVAIMLPKGYRFDFDLIIAQQHDDPPQRNNLLRLPINLTFIEPQGLFLPDKDCRYVSFIVGGDSAHAVMEVDLLRKQIEEARAQFPDHEYWLTTSRRTTASVETMLKTFAWTRAVYYRQEPLNPIPDFLDHSEYVFITADSSSMISEAVSFGYSCVEILPLKAQRSDGKLDRLLTELSRQNCLHIFAGHCGSARKKIILSAELLKAVRRAFGTA